MYICISNKAKQKPLIMTTLKSQWEAKQEEIFMLQDTNEDNSLLINILELEIHELMRKDYENQK